jgi:hypothetical protein
MNTDTNIEIFNSSNNDKANRRCLTDEEVLTLEAT